MTGLLNAWVDWVAKAKARKAAADARARRYRCADDSFLCDCGKMKCDHVGPERECPR